MKEYGNRPDVGAPAGAAFYLEVLEDLPGLNLMKYDRVYFKKGPDFKNGAIVAIDDEKGNHLFRRAYHQESGGVLLTGNYDDMPVILEGPEKIRGVAIAVHFNF